ncbi:hypothetical protein JYT79_01680, partial [Cardiobacterium sp. AH-315-I02]|nr:hypothetical protein [Cardiobacterium sp. AH-315-I02]
MLNLTLWQTKLDIANTDLKKVGLAADLIAAKKELKQASAAVLLNGERTLRAFLTQLSNPLIILVNIVDNPAATVFTAPAKPHIMTFKPAKTIFNPCQPS